jgi:hypothetical protein
VRKLKNELESLKAELRVKLAEQEQRQKVGVEESRAKAKARLSGVTAAMEAEKQNIELIRNRYKAEIVTPAEASAEKAVLNAKAQVSSWYQAARAELAQTEVTLKTLCGDAKGKPDREAERAWIIDNFDSFFDPFSETLKQDPAKHVSVVTGIEGADRGPISAIEADAAARKRNEIVAAALSTKTKTGEVE